MDETVNPQIPRLKNFADLARELRDQHTRAMWLKEAATDLLARISYESTNQLFTFADITYSLREAARAAAALAAFFQEADEHDQAAADSQPESGAA